MPTQPTRGKMVASANLWMGGWRGNIPARGSGARGEVRGSMPKPTTITRRIPCFVVVSPIPSEADRYFHTGRGEGRMRVSRVWRSRITAVGLRFATFESHLTLPTVHLDGARKVVEGAMERGQEIPRALRSSGRGSNERTLVWRVRGPASGRRSGGERASEREGRKMEKAEREREGEEERGGSSATMTIGVVVQYDRQVGKIRGTAAHHTEAEICIGAQRFLTPASFSHVVSLVSPVVSTKTQSERCRAASFLYNMTVFSAVVLGFSRR